MTNPIDNFKASMRLYVDEPPIKTAPKHKRSRSNGEGSIRKKGNGWEGRYTAGYAPDGKQVRKSVYADTRKECNEKLQAAIKEAKNVNVSIPVSNCPTLSDWLIVWLNEYRKDLSAATRKRYLSFVGKLDEKTAQKKLIALLPLDLQQYVNTFVSFDLAKRAVGMLQAALTDAMNNGFIQRNPAAGIRNPLSPPPAKFEANKKAFTFEEEKAFVQKIENNSYRLVYLVCLYAGLRRGEATALTWDKIDLNTRQISITEAAKRGEGKGYSLGKTKTSTSFRTVPISPTLFSVLMPVEPKTGFLCSSSGKMLNADILSMNFQDVMQQLGQKHTLHHLRHTFATRCMEKGIAPKAVQTWMGHASTDMTLNTYTHATEDLLTEELSKLD